MGSKGGGRDGGKSVTSSAYHQRKSGSKDVTAISINQFMLQKVILKSQFKKDAMKQQELQPNSNFGNIHLQHK